MQRPSSIFNLLLTISEYKGKFSEETKKESGYVDLLRFNFKERTISNKKTHIIKDGKVIKDYIKLSNEEVYDIKDLPLITKDDIISLKEIIKSLSDIGDEVLLSDPYLVIEKLFLNYKRSVPNSHEKFTKGNFYGVHIDELSMEEIMSNMDRTKARFILEGYVLFGIVEGFITWKNEKHFFWKSESIKELILFREWFY